jgi:crotonobetainyl-CoA:carnitine CoA-transferase CaiB-like acyl-CoA transferase
VRRGGLCEGKALSDGDQPPRGRFLERSSLVLAQRAGPIEQPGPPFRMEQTPWQTRRSPLLGEHNGEVYGEQLGYAPEDLARLRDREVI